MSGSVHLTVMLVVLASFLLGAEGVMGTLAAITDSAVDCTEVPTALIAATLKA